MSRSPATLGQASVGLVHNSLRLGWIAGVEIGVNWSWLVEAREIWPDGRQEPKTSIRIVPQSS